MFAHERYEIIINLLHKKKVVKVVELAERFNVSIETVRRDLEYLEKQGELERIYGGAALVKKTGVEVNYPSREARNQAEKREIGKKAAELIRDGDTVIFDLGTTTLEVARNLRGKNNLTVLTNSIKIAIELSNLQEINVFMLGGQIRKEELATSGFLTKYCLKQFNVDKTFIGVGGITVEDGITDYNIQEAEARRIMIEAAKQVIAVCDHTKFGEKAFINVYELDRIDTIVTDCKVPSELINDFEKTGTNIIVAKIEGYTGPAEEDDGK